MHIGTIILEYLRTAALSTFHQLAGTLGIFFLFGLVLYALSRLTRNLFHNAGYPALDLYVTGWIGTPVHELGHAIFCILFRHTITGMKLYTPAGGDGSLGYVRHSFDSKSIYQRVGNFFIGAGPIFAGTAVLTLLMMFLLPNGRQVTGIMTDAAIARITTSDIFFSLSAAGSFVTMMAGAVFTMQNISSAGFWAFVYLSICVASHMGLSPSDIKGMGSGLLTIVIALFLFNLAATLFRIDATPFVMKINTYSARSLSLFVWAVVIAFLNFVLSYMLLGILYYRRTGLLVRIV
jgi:hypothetical protein